MDYCSFICPIWASQYPFLDFWSFGPKPPYPPFTIIGPSHTDSFLDLLHHLSTTSCAQHLHTHKPIDMLHNTFNTTKYDKKQIWNMNSTRKAHQTSQLLYQSFITYGWEQCISQLGLPNPSWWMHRRRLEREEKTSHAFKCPKGK